MHKKQGWTGRYYEDFIIGDVYKHPLGRTIIVADNTWFSNITLNQNSLYHNKEYALSQGFPEPPVNHCFILALINGMSVTDTSQNGMVLEWTDVEFPNQLFVGETVYAETKVISKRELNSRPRQGIVSLKTRGFTADGKLILTFTRAILINKRM